MKARRRTSTIGSVFWLLAIALLLAACSQTVAPKNPAKSPPKLTTTDIGGSVSAESIAAGGDFTCAIKSDGTLACWGDYPSSYGVAGDKFTQISASAGDTICGLRPDGTAVCWGNSSISYDSADAFIQVVAGASHACGLRPNGTVECWGDESGGKTNPPAGFYVQLSAGSNYTCGVRTDRSLACWGAAPTTDQANIPSDLGPVLQVAVGDGVTCAIGVSGTLRCWGSISFISTHTYTQVSAESHYVCALQTLGPVICWEGSSNALTGTPDGNFIAVSAGDSINPDSRHACGIRPDDTVKCWGSGDGGQNDVPSGSATYGYRQVAAGDSFSCGLKSDGHPDCWGTTGGPADGADVRLKQISVNRGEICGIVSDHYDSTAYPYGHVACWGGDEPSNTTFRTISLAADSACGIKADGGLNCWGEFANDSPSGRYIEVGVGFYHGCAIRDTGFVQCWGNFAASDDYGQADPPAGVRFRHLSVGLDYTCGIRDNGAVLCWGDNEKGQLNSPNGVPFKQVSAGSETTCGLKADGTVVCWGDSEYGMLDAPSGTFVHISVGEYIACGIRTDGTMTCWGENNVGQAPRLTLSPETLPDAAQNVPYNQTLNATGGTAPYSYSLAPDTGLPSGLTLSATGVLSGTPTFAGTYNFTIEVTDSSGIPLSALHTYTLHVVDPTPPVITPTVTGTLGDNGWYTGDVNVSWSVTDGESTISGQTGCGAAHVTSDTNGVMFTCKATSAGGTASKSVTIKRDTTPPQVILTCPSKPVLVRSSASASWTASDEGSGLATAASGTVTLDTTSAGQKTATTPTASDNAGLTASANCSYSVDATAPVAHPTLNPPANAHGWNNSDVTVTWNWAGEAGGSGIDTANCTTTSTSPSGVEGGGTILSATCSDKAGNVGNASDTVNVDKSDPTTPTASFDRAPDYSGASGTWYKNSVTVSFVGSSDEISYVASYSPAQTFNTTGTHPYSGTATDAAGNVSAATTGTVNVDATPPQVTLTCPSNPVPLGSNASASWTASDADSGLATPASGSVTLDTASGGQHTATKTVSDNVGLTANANCTYSVVNPNPTPVTSSVSPMTIVAGGGETPLTVNGSSFTDTSVVRWNGADLTTSFLSPSQLSATVPASSLTTAATAEVTVFNPAPGGGTSDPQFVFITQEPTSVTNTESANSAGGAATASTAAVTAEATGGDGTIVVAEYASNPGGVPSFNSNGEYFDVYLTRGSTFGEVTVSLCNASPSNTAYWWNGTAWEVASNQSYDTSSGCLIITVNSGASPSISQLTGTIFGLANFDFSGFFRPIDNRPTVNKVKAGRAIPVKFSLNGDQGLDILESGSPSSQQILCDSGAPTSDVEQTVTAGHSGLQYDADSDTYTYVWKTDKGWGGTCRVLSVTLVDGTTHTADFQFK